MRELINEDGRPFADDIDQVKAELAGLPNDGREDFRNRNASAIACHPARRLLIVAGPGSGKSFLFLDRIRYWLTQDTGARIYVSTFVRKLVNDLLNEIEVKLDAETAKQVNGSTLHSLARSILERSGGASGLSLGPYVKVIAGDHWERVVWRDVLAFHPGVTGHTIGVFKAQYQDDALSAEPTWVELRATYDRLRSFYNAVGFADMIVSARQAIKENAGLVEHTFWIVDEFQDFNRAEEHLIRVLTGNADGVLIAGDDEQALYQQLKGATPEIIVAYYGDPDFANAMLPYCSRCSYYICLAASAFMDHHRDEGSIAKSYLPLAADPDATKVQVVLTAAPRTAVAYVERFLKDHAEELRAHEQAMSAGDEADPFLLILSPQREVSFYLDAAEELFDLVSAWGTEGAHRSRDYWLVVEYCMAAWRADNFAVRKILDHEGASTPAVHDLIERAVAESKSLAELDDDLIREALAKSHQVVDIVEPEETSAPEKAAQCAETLPVGDVDRLARELEQHPISKTGPADEGDASVEGTPALAAVEVMSLVGAKGLSAKHVIVLGCDTTNMGYATTLQFYVALSRARKSVHLITALKAKGASEVHPYVYDIPEEYCDYLAFKRDGIERLAGQIGLKDKLRRLTSYRKKR